MDFGGLLGMEVFLGSSPTTFSPSLASELESIRKRNLFGSHILKQGRSTIAEEDEWRCPKIARTSCAEQMLSFSSSKTSSLMHISDSPSASAPSPPSSAAPSRVLSSSGLNLGGFNVNMQGAMRGPFTLFQRMELEQQILIYSYIRANVPIPTNLLCSLRRGLNPSGFSACPTGAFRPNAAWWGYINPCFVGNADAEPGRCRRTDGKKWRCSRDAVLDQKYCERHINRGRHRSRKPVEGQSGHARKAVTIIADPTSASAGPCGSQSSNPLTVSRHQIKNLHATIDTSPSQLWMVAGGNSVNDHQNSARDPSILASAANSFDSCLTSKNYSPLEGASPLALDSSNALLSQLGGSFSTHDSFVTALEHDHKSQQPHKLGHFIDDDWLPSQSDCTTIIWPDSLGLQSKRTQPSVTFPMTSSDFSSSTSSPAPERFSPLHMGLGLGGIPNELNSVPHGYTGGPLGEALTSTSSTAVDENESFLSLMNDGWDLSPQLASSVSNAMHSTPLSSVSSGSAGDVMVEKHTTEGFNCHFGHNNAKSTNFAPL